MLGSLLLFTGAVYGLTWALTKSRALLGLREWLTGQYGVPNPTSSKPGAFVWEYRRERVALLLGCIACTGTWVGLILAALSPLTSLDLVHTWADVPLLAAWSTGACWMIGRATGDAE